MDKNHLSLQFYKQQTEIFSLIIWLAFVALYSGGSHSNAAEYLAKKIVNQSFLGSLVGFPGCCVGRRRINIVVRIAKKN